MAVFCEKLCLVEQFNTHLRIRMPTRCVQIAELHFWITAHMIVLLLTMKSTLICAVIIS